MKENAILMKEAREALQGNWGTAAIATLIFVVIMAASGMIYIGPILLGGPLLLGYIYFIINLQVNPSESTYSTLFKGFDQFGRTFLAYLLMNIYVFLWSLLFVIPGIIMSIAYSMTFFIMAEDDTISASDALKKSKQMMDGYKWKFFCLCLRFIGWIILASLTFGIGLLWLEPYMRMSFYNFYQDIKPKEMIEIEVEFENA